MIINLPRCLEFDWIIQQIGAQLSWEAARVTGQIPLYTWFVPLYSLWQYSYQFCSRCKKVLRSAHMLVAYQLWSLISIGHASGFLNSCIVFANEDSFAHSICKKDLASRRQSMMALGKRWFGFRRFKKCWRAFATRAKAHRLDQNWQSLAHKAQRSNHWAKTANLTYQDANHCNYNLKV